MNIAIPSRGRADTIKAHKISKDAIIFVPESERKEYESKLENKIVGMTIKDETIAKVRNFILDYFKEGEEILMFDDDIYGFQRLENGKLVDMSFDEFLKFAEYAFKEIRAKGIKLWGIYPVDNAFFMSEGISLKAFIIGRCMGFINSELRFDVELAPVKEDYEMTLKQIEKFGLVQRFDNITFKKEKDFAKGGCSSYRTKKMYEEVSERLVNKYPHLVRHNPRKKGEILVIPPNYYGSPRWTGEILDCSMPMTFDTYNLCNYKCQYCFSFFQRSHSSDDYINNEIKWVNIDKIKKLFRGQIKNSQFNDYIKERKVMQWGGLSEPFDLAEKRLGITLELLRFFKEINYPLSICTKSVWFLKDKRYTDVIKGQTNWHFKFTIITDDPEASKLVEVNTPTPQERLDALKKLKELGIPHITLRLRPFIVGISDKSYNSLIRKANEAGVDSVSTEFFCMESRADQPVKDRYKVISDACGFDIWKFYWDNSYQAGYKRLNYSLKQPYIDGMKKLCDELGLRFYVSDAHHKEKCHNGSCCGLPKEFNYSRGQFTEAIVIAKEKGEVKWSDIEQHLNMHKKYQFIKADGFNHGNSEKRAKFVGFTMYDWIKYKWNNPSNGESPYKYFDKVLYPVRLDEQKNIVYAYNPERNQLNSTLK